MERESQNEEIKTKKPNWGNQTKTVHIGDIGREKYSNSFFHSSRSESWLTRLARVSRGTWWAKSRMTSSFPLESFQRIDGPLNTFQISIWNLQKISIEQFYFWTARELPRTVRDETSWSQRSRSLVWTWSPNSSTWKAMNAGIVSTWSSRVQLGTTGSEPVSTNICAVFRNLWTFWQRQREACGSKLKLKFLDVWTDTLFWFEISVRIWRSDWNGQLFSFLSNSRIQSQLVIHKLIDKLEVSITSW